VNDLAPGSSASRLGIATTRLPDMQGARMRETLPEGSDWTYEVKLDGYRAIGVRTSRETILYSRNHKNFNRRFPQIADALGDLPADTVIDGEGVS
jgi:bifunctional non-homologous end joining protein LigD